ncbi:MULTISPECIES: hypothetical protein [Legionella]|uniref:hypothetical protein n=1 Tax=Legionella TaxID=445 RepID=UPI000963FF31|nr:MULTISPECIES: hypothetical protein [Legionella]MBN9228470.1 hypothetical protein [Legionella steelei]OJW09029.1 MAG: hypothetical protein BGO44_15635 [Legionella sp. 39-23]
MGKKRKLAVFDVDGPINRGYHKPQDTSNDIYYVSPNQDEAAIGAGDFVAINMPFVKLTLDILHQNNVHPVIGSQRIQMADDDPRYGSYIKTMYGALDHFLGKDRPFLKEDIARDIGKALRETNTEQSKNELLKAYQERLGVAAEDIIFIDDDLVYKNDAEQAGHLFVHAPVSIKTKCSVDDNAYLYETLLRTVPAHDIYRSIEQSKASSQEKNEFKKQLLTYQLEHLNQVTQWQQQVLTDEGLLTKKDVSKAVLTPKEQAAKATLQGIQYLIMDTKWDIGMFGGEKIVDEVTGIKNTVPKGMNEVLKTIEQAKNGAITWNEALTQVEKQINESATKKDHGVFNRRGETSQLFYDKAKDVLKQLREGEVSQDAEQRKDDGMHL